MLELLKIRFFSNVIVISNIQAIVGFQSAEEQALVALRRTDA